MNWFKYGYVISAPNRVKIVKLLDVERTPSQLTKLSKLPDSNVSRTLRDLVSKGIVEILTPQNKRGRVYRLSKIGKEIRERLLK